MSFALLAVQAVLVLLLVVVPALSGWDKFRRWPPARKAAAIALGLGIAVIAFTQYKSLVMLHRAELPGALNGFVPSGRVPWYARKISVMPLEYVVSLLACGVLFGLAFAAMKRRRYAQVGGYAVSLIGLVATGLMLKLGLWR